MSSLPPEIARAQAVALLGADIGERRAGELAGDVGKIVEALDAARPLLDFNDEPARFAARLDASVRKRGYAGKPGFPSARAAARPEPKASAAASHRK